MFNVSVLAEKFSTSPQDVAAVVGQSVRFSCSITSAPAALFIWRKNGRPLTSDDNHRYNYILHSPAVALKRVEGVDVWITFSRRKSGTDWHSIAYLC